jgi:glycogen debranching enzyme
VPFEQAAELVRRCATANGFIASPSLDHYNGIWARDAALIGLGALTLGEESLNESAAATVDTLFSHASELGQVPAVVWPQRGRWDWGEGGAVDATAWTVILAAAVVEAVGDLRDGWKSGIEAAMRWLSYQDVTGSGLISAAPSTDWMDAALTRSGRTLHLNVLYAWAARSASELGLAGPEPEDLRRRVNLLFWPDPRSDLGALYPHGFGHEASRVAFMEAAAATRRHYLSHVIHAAFVDRCDVLANLLAIVAGVADRGRALLILDYLDRVGIIDPYPSRTFPDPIPASDASGMWLTMAEAVIPTRWRNRPGRYHNGAVWPYIGGIHAWASALTGRRWEAERILHHLKAANRLGEGFPEWIHPESGEPAGASLQGWNAGTYLLAEAAIAAVR